MNNNNNLTPLPFHTSKDKQIFRRSYAYGQTYPLVADVSKLLPFQIVVPYAEQEVTITEALLVSPCEDLTLNITDAIESNIFQMAYDGYTVLLHYADQDSVEDALADISNRCFYLALHVESQDGFSQWYYSEPMELSEELVLSGCIKVEWTSQNDIIYKGGRLVYEGLGKAYINRMYVKSEIGRPSYEFSEEGNDRNGYYFATKQISEKSYRFNFLCTEPVCDFVRLVGLHDLVRITDQTGEVYDCDTFLPTFSWQEQGYLSSVECEFQTDTMVVQSARSLDTLNWPED